MKTRFAGITVKLAKSKAELDCVMDLRKRAYGRYEWAANSELMGREDLDDQIWTNSLLALRGTVPMGTMRLVRANASCLDRLSSYITWPEEITTLAIEGGGDVIEFNRFAVAAPEVAPMIAGALLKAAMAIQLIESISLIVGEIRRDHVAYYERFLGMTPSVESRSDGILPGEFHLVTGQPQKDIERLRSRSAWMVPSQADLESWRKSGSVSWVA